MGLDATAAKRLVEMAFDAEINFFDTAEVYSYGQAEEILGKALHGKRDQVILATKVRSRLSVAINDVGLRRRHIVHNCENSLK